MRQTWQIDFVSNWEVIHHEIFAVSDTFWNFTRPKFGERKS